MTEKDPRTSPRRHVNVHEAWGRWSEDQTLHLIAPYSNPFRYRSRRELFHRFVDAMKHTPNVILHVVEAAYGDRPFEVTDSENPDDVQLRTSHILWHKENLISIGIQRLRAGWKYAGYADGDFTFSRQDWALEAIHQLQISPWVQLYSSYANMGLDHRPLQVRPSFAYAYHNYFGSRCAAHKIPGIQTIRNYQGLCPTQILNTTPGATGGAWAFTTEGFSSVGGLLESCVLGAADWYMAFGLVGNKADGHPEAVSCGRPYEESIRRWQDRAFEKIRGNIGYVENFCTHGWHGDLKNRGYGDRWKILRDHQYDPLIDISKDWQGLLSWTGNKPLLEMDVRRYFLSRNEDSTESQTKALI